MTPIDWKRRQQIAGANQQIDRGRQSLVTPIDWKLGVDAHGMVSGDSGRQSLVTPIDWKRDFPCNPSAPQPRCRQSLVTPIDWKPIHKMGTRALKHTSPILGDAY